MYPPLEQMAAVSILRESCSGENRVINVVDAMRLLPDSKHPHGLSDANFDALFTADKPIIFAYHGYPLLIHRPPIGVIITRTCMYTGSRKKVLPPRPLI